MSFGNVADPKSEYVDSRLFRSTVIGSNLELSMHL